jgi:DNA recombination protein RmuC
MDLTFLAIGLAAGLILGYMIYYLVNKSKTVSRKKFEELETKQNETFTSLQLAEDRLQSIQTLHQSLNQRMQLKETEASQYVSINATNEANIKNLEFRNAELTESITSQAAANRLQQDEINKNHQRIAEMVESKSSLGDNLSTQKDLNEKQTIKIDELNVNQTELVTTNTRLTEQNKSLNEKLATQKTEMEGLQKTAHLQFEKIANEIFEDKSVKFTETNKTNMEGLLNPLKEDIGKFKTKVEETYDKESKQRFSLEEKVRDLIEQTNKVSTEANNLATALKGQTKKQGNWGEMILERILETSGLTKDREYFVQQTIKDEDGNNLRPDILVKLPDDRVVIIDSKVSLTAYDRFSATEIADEQKVFLGEHMRSIYNHIEDLSKKKYDNLENSLDFTMMFVPIEPAYMISIQADQQLWAYAYSRRILLISPTNLIACLRLITDLWKREKQSKNAMEIVKRGELMYDKFVAFVSTFEDVGKFIGKSQSAYSLAIDQLKSGRGNLIAQSMQLHNLGLKSNKKIPPTMLPIDFEEDPTPEFKLPDATDGVPET